MRQIDFIAMQKDRALARSAVSAANKRIRRLKAAGMDDSPAMTYVSERGMFGIKGKTGNEYRSEVAQLAKFLNARTSTLRGYDEVLKQTAYNLNIKYDNKTQLRQTRRTVAKIFEISSKAEQYLRNVHGIASAIGYQRVWEVVGEYVQQVGDTTVDEALEVVIEKIMHSDTDEKRIEDLFDLGDFKFLD